MPRVNQQLIVHIFENRQNMLLLIRQYAVRWNEDDIICDSSYLIQVMGASSCFSFIHTHTHTLENNSHTVNPAGAIWP